MFAYGASSPFKKGISQSDIDSDEIRRLVREYNIIDAYTDPQAQRRKQEIKEKVREIKERIDTRLRANVYG